MTMFFWLVAGHALADYPLQGDFMSAAKNHRTSPWIAKGVNWWIVLFMHAMIHAAVVAHLTSSIGLGLTELILHFVIDYEKCEGNTTFLQDQVLHILCKGAYAWIATSL